MNQKLRAIARLITSLFALWVALAAGLAFCWPQGFRWLAPYINLGLGAVMFGMGVTFTPSDFERVIKTPYAVAVGVMAQFLAMPLIAAFLAKVLELPPAVAAGLILVGSCPGGTASNVMVYLANGDVALSVTLTSVSTMFSVIATPLLMQWLAGQYLPVDAVAMLWSILIIIILPVSAGLAFHRIAGTRMDGVKAVMPILSVVVIVILVACVVSLSRSEIASSGGTTMAAVILHNGLGLAVGYGIAKLAGLGPVRQRAVALEVGMQNAALAVVLAVTHFAGQPLVSLPAAIFGVWANISGPALASYWSSREIAAKATSAVPSPYPPM